MLKVFVSIVLLMAISACSVISVDLNAVKGSGTLATEVRQVAEFTEVELAGSADVEVTVGGEQKVVVEADDNILPLVETNVVNGRLVIRIKPNNSILTGFTVRVSITMPAMQAALLTGSGNLTVRDLTGEKVELTLSGSGNIVVDGKVTELTAELTGSGNIQCEDLDAEVVTAKLSGSGNINVNATRELDARLLGSGNIRYGGSPATVKETDSGSGEIIPLR